MSGFVEYMQSTKGRILRMALGTAIIAYGFFGNGGVLLGLLGMVPLIAGGFGACLFAPLFGYTVWGEKKVSAGSRV